MPVVIVPLATVAHEVPHPDRLYFADGARIDDVLHDSEDVHVAHVEADHELLARFLPGFQHAVAALGGDGHWFFAEDVLAGLEGGADVLLVGEVGAGDGHGVDVVAGEQLLIVEGRKGVAVDVLFEHVQGFLRDVGAGDDDGSTLGVVPVAGDAAASGYAYDADAELGHLGPPIF